MPFDMYRWLLPVLFSDVEVAEEEGCVTTVWPSVEAEVEVPVPVVFADVKGANILR